MFHTIPPPKDVRYLVGGSTFHLDYQKCDPGKYSNAVVIYANGKIVAVTSYNGRIWSKDRKKN